MGYNNSNQEYDIYGCKIEAVDSIKDLGVIINKKFKVNYQVANAAKKANQILGLIGRTFECRNKNIILKLYKSLVRPHLDYCVQVWNPHLAKDIILLQRVQKRATKMISSLKNQRYEQRLRMLNLTTLETRRIRADILQTFKIVKGYEKLNMDSFFSRNINNNRGHILKLV